MSNDAVAGSGTGVMEKCMLPLPSPWVPGGVSSKRSVRAEMMILYWRRRRRCRGIREFRADLGIVSDGRWLYRMGYNGRRAASWGRAVVAGGFRILGGASCVWVWV